MFFIENFLEVYNKYKEYILFLIVLILTIISNAFIYIYFDNNINELETKLQSKKEETKVEPIKEKNYIVDIKGEVKKPGVYTLNKNDRVIDVVKKAGGFTKYADTSANNLSKKIEDEMVIVIYSEDEIENYLREKDKEKQIEEKCNNDIIKNDSCIKKDEQEESSSQETKETGNSTKTKLVNINTATKEELTSITGIGNSKAEAIIEYRKKEKFNTIEDIKNVSGIGDSLYEKIKEYITT